MILNQKAKFFPFKSLYYQTRQRSLVFYGQVLLFFPVRMQLRKYALVGRLCVRASAMLDRRVCEKVHRVA